MVSSNRLRMLVVVVAVMSPLVWVSQAGAHELVEFETQAALAANGPIPPVPAKPLEEVKAVCGSETATFGGELLQAPVPYEWADIVPGKEMEVSGTVTQVELSHEDLPLDHPFSRDFTFDVKLDEPYWPLARGLGPGIPEGAGNENETHELHMEIETGALLHALPQRHVAGEPWEILPSEPPEPTLTSDALENLEGAYLPQEGERIAMKGHWIIDCGHNDFHSALHPVTFMAFAHPAGKKTVLHMLSNPYRVTELYGGSSQLNSTNPPTGQPLLGGLEAAVKSTVESAVLQGNVGNLEMAVGLERTKPTTTPLLVCPPAPVGRYVRIAHHFVTRKGVTTSVTRSYGINCARVSARVGGRRYKRGSGWENTWGSYTALQPSSGYCALRWPWLNAKLAQGLHLDTRSNEYEQITVVATGGTFTITYGGDTTAPIPYNASAAEVQGALEALPNLKPGDITVAGGPEGGETRYVLTFGGELAETAVTPVTTDRSALTGKLPRLATVTVLTPGGLLDLHRTILSEVEVQKKAYLEGIEEVIGGSFVGAVSRMEESLANTPFQYCLDPLSAPPVNPIVGKVVDNTQPFPYYGEVQVE